VSAAVLGLVLIAAVMHATWNVLAKRASGGIAFIWLSFLMSIVLYTPVAVVVAIVTHAHFGLVQVAFVVGNGVLHLIYFITLQRGYRSGDLSVVYPLARGSGPLLTVAFAGLLFGEKLSLVASFGVLLIAGGIFLTASKRATPVSIAYGLLTGASIAAYTLWDKESVAFLAINPIVYDVGGNLARFALLTPFVIKRGADIAAEWRTHRSEAAGIAILSPLAYLLVLWALVTTPVSYVAPARELSILVGTVAGTLIFRERHGRRRFVAAAAILAGILLLLKI
jgi:multidrug transporter EmrE-like cation transporter